VEVTLTYNALTNRWEGVTPDACAGNFDLSIILECDPATCGPGNGCEGWKLTETFKVLGTVADQCVNAGCSCDPLELTFALQQFQRRSADGKCYADSHHLPCVRHQSGRRGRWSGWLRRR